MKTPGSAAGAAKALAKSNAKEIIENNLVRATKIMALINIRAFFINYSGGISRINLSTIVAAV
jgi:hypothetical protein